MKKIIITGATSMIGRNFIDYLLKNHEDVEILVILREGSSKNILIPKSDRIKTIECSIDNLKSLETEETGDVLIHLAWQGVKETDINSTYIQTKNIEGTLDAVKLAKKMNCKKFIGTGSQAEYRKSRRKNFTKTSERIQILHMESQNFVLGNLSRKLANLLGIEHIWLRIASVYGPYDRENTMINISINEMLKGESPEYTKAEQIWDYLYAEDMAKALYLVCEKGKNNSIYCVGSGKQKILKEYIEEIRNQINPNLKLKIGYKDYDKNQVMNLAVDISNLTADTGFMPDIEFEEGIKRTIEFIRNGGNL